MSAYISVFAVAAIVAADDDVVVVVVVVFACCCCCCCCLPVCMFFFSLPSLSCLDFSPGSVYLEHDQFIYM